MTDRFSPDEIEALRDIAGTMIPAVAELGVPGAADPAIFDDIVKSMGRDLPQVREALAALTVKLAPHRERDRREAAINDYARSGGPAAATLGRVLLAAYYRDDRVLRALEHEARAPFPQGYTVDQGDWSLLDAVRGRPPLWRDDRARGER